MLRNCRVALGVGCFVAVLFLISSTCQAAQAGDGTTAVKVSKKSKAAKPAEKPAKESAPQGAEKKEAGSKPAEPSSKPAAKKPDAKKPEAAKLAEGYHDFEKDAADTDAASTKKSGATADKKKDESSVSEKASDKAKPAEPAKPSVKAGEKAGDKTIEKTRKTVVRIVLSGEYPEGPAEAGLFAEIQPSLKKLLDRLQAAKTDKEVVAVWLRIEDLELGRGKINEVRAAIAELRKAGKPVYAELTAADTGAYLIASACNHVFMPSSGMLIVPGVRMEVTFYKGLMDKLGLKFDVLKMGKFKGAVEPYSRETMSEPFRENLKSIVDDTYEHSVALIAKDRKLEDYQVKSIVDQGLFSAASAKDAGLIDEITYADQFEASLAARLKIAKVDVDAAYKKQDVDTDFSGIGGLAKLIEAMGGGKKASRGGTKQKIALVYAVGEIAQGKSRSGLFGGSSVGSTTMVETLRKAFNDPKVVAVVLRVDSPGGSSIASDLIWRETVRHKKPMVASMGNVAASGGYYIAMGARKIYAEPGTITGSIGVFGGKLVFGGLYDKIGLNTEVVSRGKNSGAMSSTQPFTADERRVWTQLLTETYREFVTKAAEGRKMEYNRIDDLAQGRIYTGRQAKKLGLVDEIGTLNDAIAEAKKLAGLKSDTDIEIEVLPQSRSFFEQLFGGEAASEFTSALPEAARILRQAQIWRQLLGEKILVWMPYRVELK